MQWVLKNPRQSEPFSVVHWCVFQNCDSKVIIKSNFKMEILIFFYCFLDFYFYCYLHEQNKNENSKLNQIILKCTNIFVL